MTASSVGARTQGWVGKWAVFIIPGLSASVSLPFLPTPSPLLLLAPFFAWSFTLVPRSCSETARISTQATQATKDDRNSLPKGRLRQGQRRYKAAYYTTWTPATLSLQKEFHCLWFCVTIYWTSILSENIGTKNLPVKQKTTYIYETLADKAKPVHTF